MCSLSTIPDVAISGKALANLGKLAAVFYPTLYFILIKITETATWHWIADDLYS